GSCPLVRAGTPAVGSACAPLGSTPGYPAGGAARWVVTGTLLTTQRTALRALGLHGGRPPRELASTDPAGYLAGLARAGQAAELLDPAGLGGVRRAGPPAGGAAPPPPPAPPPPDRAGPPPA